MWRKWKILAVAKDEKNGKPFGWKRWKKVIKICSAKNDTKSLKTFAV